MVSHLFIWIIVATTICLILVRPRQIPEAVWALSGASLLVVARLVSMQDAWSAMGRGLDVYLFLTGMMVLAELARREGIFDWVAGLAVHAARGSQPRLFCIVYAVGTLVTIFLSNDATAVVLTPAVLAAVKRANAKPLPYLFACAFIANAASFVLPISNPANLVMYGSKMPLLNAWFRSFGRASLVSITVTFEVLWFLVRKKLEPAIKVRVEEAKLSRAGRRAAVGLTGAALTLLLASALNLGLGLPTCVAAVAATVLVALEDRGAPLSLVKNVSWSVVPLVAGLFVLVEAANQAGALSGSRSLLQEAATLTPLTASFSASFGIALLSNIANNLPVGLITASALSGSTVSNALRNALLIGVDLGPNLSVSGSLATILWLTAIRRDGENVSFAQFSGYGMVVMPPALALSVWLSCSQG